LERERKKEKRTGIQLEIEPNY